MILGPCCINCEKKKPVKNLITLGERSGFICSSCYDSNIWAQNRLSKSGSDLIQKIERGSYLYSMPEDIPEENEGSRKFKKKLSLAWSQK